MDFLYDYGLFFSKFASVVILIAILLLIFVAVIVKAKTKEKIGQLTIRSLNNHYEEMSAIINSVILTKFEKKHEKRKQKKETKIKTKLDEVGKHKPRLFIINFNGDIRASAVNALREEVSGVLVAATKEDQVLVRLESGGGMVNAYGLASSQLQRIKDAGIKLIISVDKVAASGGYMMACMADLILSAPFAIIGSIGVIAQLPNLHRFLEHKNIDFEQITAGQYKRTLTVFGKNTAEGRKKLQSEVNDIHDLFKEHIKINRPQIDIDKVATGEHWFGIRAKELNLVDELQTSDDFLLSGKDKFGLYELQYRLKKPLGQKLGGMVRSLSDRLVYRDIQEHIV